MKSSYYKYFAALLLFGSNGIVASNINLPSYEIVLLRLLLGSLFLITVFTVSRQRFTFYRNKHTCLYLFISASAMGASWMLLYEAYQQVGISIASLAYYCGPVIVMILSPFLFRETLTWPKIAGFLTVLAGMCLVNLQALDEGKTIWGLFCGLMSAFMYALMVTANKKAKPESGLENSLLQLVIGSFIVVAFVSMQKNFVLSLTTIDWIPVLRSACLIQESAVIYIFLLLQTCQSRPLPYAVIWNHCLQLFFLYSFYMKSCCLYKCSEPYLYLAAPYLENASILKNSSGCSQNKAQKHNKKASR